jgi:hypothetical protein
MSTERFGATRERQIEELLKLESGNFDTRKVVNRSEKRIPTDIVERIEAGSVLHEDLDALNKNYPIFKYRSCLTVHGDWPEVQRERIGSYKNIKQNQNGSLEVLWTAIDLDRKKRISDALQTFGSPFSFSISSKGTLFVADSPIINNQQELDEQIARFRGIAERIMEVSSLSRVFLYRASGWSGLQIVCEVHQLSVREHEVDKLVLAMSECRDQAELDQRKVDHEAKRAAERLERQKQNEEYRKIEAAKRLVDDAEMAKAAEAIAHLQAATSEPQPGQVYVTVSMQYPAGDYSKKVPTFTYIRNDGKGSFGRTKVSIAKHGTFTLSPEWKKGKEGKGSEIFDNNRLSLKSKWLLVN